MFKKTTGFILAGFLSLFLINSVAAATMEEVENNYQNGLKYGNQGNLDSAIDFFQKVLSADPLSLGQEYYRQTYGDAYLNLGILYGKKLDYLKAVENLNKALELVPNNNRAMYYLAVSSCQLGEIAQAKLYFEKIKSLGSPDIQSNDFLSNFLSNYQEKESVFMYNYFFDSNRNAKVTIKGDSSSNEQLMQDTLMAIEKISLLKDVDSVPVSAKVIRQNQQGTLIIEKWAVGPINSRKDFWVKYNTKPPSDFPSKIMIIVSDREMTLDEK